MGHQLGGTDQILPLHVFWTCHAGARPYRVQCRVARCEMGLPAHTCHPIWRLLACFARAIPEAKRGRDRNPISDRSSCPLRPSVLCSFYSTLGTGGRRFLEARRDASRQWTSRTLRARHSSFQACQHRFLGGCGYAALWSSVQVSLSASD